MPRLKNTKFCTQIQSFTIGNLRRKRYYLPKPTENFRIIKKEVLTDTNITSEEKGFIIALYCNCVNNSFNLSLSSWKFWESKIKVSKSTFYKLKKSLVSRGYLRNKIVGINKLTDATILTYKDLEGMTIIKLKDYKFK